MLVCVGSAVARDGGCISLRAPHSSIVSAAHFWRASSVPCHPPSSRPAPGTPCDWWGKTGPSLPHRRGRHTRGYQQLAVHFGFSLPALYDWQVLSCGPFCHLAAAPLPLTPCRETTKVPGRKAAGEPCCDWVSMEDSSGEWPLTKSGSPGFLEEVTFDCPLKAKAVVC